MIQSLIEKCNLYKRDYDKYQVACNLIDEQKDDTVKDQTSLVDSTHLVCIDMAYPGVVINKAQMVTLKGVTTGGAATRTLLDMLFEEEEFRGKNCSILEKENADKIKAIRSYVGAKYSISEAKITKAITGKCKGY